MKIPFKLFIYLFVILLLVISFPLALFFPFKLALIIGFFFACVGCLFSLGFVQREMKQDTLIITSGKKKKEVPMSWYENEIREQISLMRFEYKGKTGDTERFIPTGLYNVFETPIELEVSPYLIKTTGSRLFIRIIAEITEIASEAKNI